MDLTIVILTYNVKDLTRKCLVSAKKALEPLINAGYNAEIFLPDNGSTDGTVEMVRKEFPEVKVYENKNIGFAKGNNVVRNDVKSKYVLFLNPDTEVSTNTLIECFYYMEAHADVGAMTCRVELPDGSLDKDTRRSFTTPWIGFTHFSGLEKLFPKSKLFGSYWYGYIPDDIEHEVDVIQGAFCLTRKNILDQINWYDEDYFLDGEDMDLCWKIKELGYSIIYYPKVKIIHYKGASKGKSPDKKLNTKVDLKKKLLATMTGSNSMKIFFDKRLKSTTPWLLTQIVYLGIFLLKLKRIFSIIVLGKR